jgi:lysophospholipase L1-like esterase
VKIFKYLLVVLVIIFFCWLLFFRGSNKEIKNNPSLGDTNVAFGDSLVEGVGSTKGNDLFSVLSEKIGEPIKNYGKAGDTTAIALERLSEVLEEVPRPKVAIIILGGNDFLRQVPKEETFNNLEKIITAFQDRGAVVLLLGVRGGLIKDNYEGEYRALAESLGAAYVSNILKGLITNREFMYDSIHPNDIGYRMIADRVEPVLLRIVD